MDSNELRVKVGQYFAAADVTAQVTESGYRIYYGSTAVDVDIIEQEHRVLIFLNAPVVIGAPDTPELARWVAVEGQQMYFGTAALRPRDGGLADVWVHHTLLGDYLDEDELHNATAAVVNTADDWDDELQSRFGGKRVEDL